MVESREKNFISFAIVYRLSFLWDMGAISLLYLITSLVTVLGGKHFFFWGCQSTRN